MDRLDEFISKLENMSIDDEEWMGTDHVKRISKNKFIVDVAEMDLLGAAMWISIKYG